MKIQKFFGIIAALTLAVNCFGANKSEVEVPRTVQKDIYKYYIIEESKKTTLFNVTLKRLSYDTTLYIKVEVNCPSRVIRELGNSIKSAKAISTDTPKPWVKPVIGSIQSDIITYVCR